VRNGLTYQQATASFADICFDADFDYFNRINKCRFSWMLDLTENLKSLEKAT
jgi:hypothetical protein